MRAFLDKPCFCSWGVFEISCLCAKVKCSQINVFELRALWEKRCFVELCETRSGQQPGAARRDSRDAAKQPGSKRCSQRCGKDAAKKRQRCERPECTQNTQQTCGKDAAKMRQRCGKVGTQRCGKDAAKMLQRCCPTSNRWRERCKVGRNIDSEWRARKKLEYTERCITHQSNYSKD